MLGFYEYRGKENGNGEMSIMYPKPYSIHLRGTIVPRKKILRVEVWAPNMAP